MSAPGSLPRQAPALGFKMFRSMSRSWHELFRRAALFAAEVGPDRLASISHSSDNSDGVVTVWYWTLPGEPGALPVVGEGGELSPPGEQAAGPDEEP